MLQTAWLPPQKALDAGLRPGPFPDPAASLLPGLLAATRTGLTPAGDDELMLDHDLHVDLQLWAHPGQVARQTAAVRKCSTAARRHCRAPGRRRRPASLRRWPARTSRCEARCAL